MNIDYTHHYRKWHDDSEGHRRRMAIHYNALLASHLPAQHNAAILDVGCGMGFALLALKDMGYQQIRGVDCDGGQVAQAQSFGLEVDQCADTCQWLNAHLAQFDTILCLDVIEHLEVHHQIPFVRAMAGALRNGGRLICTVPNANASLSGRWRYIDWTHHTSFTEHSLDFLLHNSGFETIEILPAETRPTPPHPWLPVSGTRNWWLWRFFRWLRRLEMIAEFGRQDGSAIPISLNLLAVANKR